MTTPIKPPGADPTSATELAAEGVPGGAAAPHATEAARAASDPQTVDALSGMAQALADGTVTPAQAVERLVERAVAGVAEHLDPAAREELALALREAIENDPGLRALRDELG